MPPVLYLTAHRLVDGALAPLGEERLLDGHENVTIEDEDALALVTDDGGECWIEGASSDHRYDRPLGVHLDVLRSTEQVIGFIYDYARTRGYAIAVWQSDYPRPWERDAPIAVVAPRFEAARTPTHWPNLRYARDAAQFREHVDERRRRRHLRPA